MIGWGGFLPKTQKLRSTPLRDEPKPYGLMYEVTQNVHYRGTPDAEGTLANARGGTCLARALTVTRTARKRRLRMRYIPEVIEWLKQSVQYEAFDAAPRDLG